MVGLWTRRASRPCPALPGRDELRANLLATFNAVPQNFLALLNAAPQNFVYLLVNREEKLKEGGAAE